jgi:hypothetical protein
MDNYGYGVDIAMIFQDGQGDLDPNLTLVSGPIVVAQSLYIDCMAVKGSIIGDRSAGAGLGVLPNSPIKENEIKAAIYNRAMSDDRVVSAVVDVKKTGSSYEFQLNARLIGGSSIAISEQGVL